MKPHWVHKGAMQLSSLLGTQNIELLSAQLSGEMFVPIAWMWNLGSFLRKKDCQQSHLKAALLSLQEPR